ncbi:DOPA 4,5-dioxygenase family protein [Thalassococcus sp. S3]|uniref:DOPA 4,5-dioxygenase family protein n=1 Tax=Thalassococcus sp. S3 TaxID=2017482 RepID=UPI0010246E35|nr:DOPA 4,5-dioxygenase family protein [Thalassococcus sp. S3]QBF33680.1 4,5-dioxygenase [Thalassococcus sp. S3]
MPEISGYHAHVYFDAETKDLAARICSEARDLFGIDMGRIHERAVGPHPCWSCQLAFGPAQASDVIGWLATHRAGLTVFLHPETGNALQDHRDHAIWMGAQQPLKLDIFE